VSGGDDHTCGIQVNASLWCWGQNFDGELGIGHDAGISLTPAAVRSRTAWTSVATGAHHTCAIGGGGELWCWGDNAAGQLGLGDTLDRWVPIRVDSAKNWASVAAGLPFCERSCPSAPHHTCATKTDQSIWCWGDNARGELGVKDRLDRRYPMQLAGGGWGASLGGGGQDTCDVKADNTLWCWGWNNFGKLGLGDTRSRTAPSQV
jgi:alpha-tubulin suppressor-like RCC1 family protein